MVKKCIILIEVSYEIDLIQLLPEYKYVHSLKGFLLIYEVYLVTKAITEYIL